MAKFQPGKSGNPGGRPKGYDGDVRQLARSGTKRAMKALLDLIDHEDPNVKLKAAQLVLERGWGKPEQSVSIDHRLDARDLENTMRLARERTGAALGIYSNAPMIDVTPPSEAPKQDGLVIDLGDDEDWNLS